MLVMLVLADDLTGALEVGAKFAVEGIRSLVSTELSLSPPGLDEETQVLVVDTESRHLGPDEARLRVLALARKAREREIRYLYKKTDSTLRGNIGAELDGLSAGAGRLPVLYAPAYPEMGRTVRDGQLYVRGVPVSETEFGSDLLNPVMDSHVSLVLATQTRLPIYSASVHNFHGQNSEAIYVFDGTAERDISEIAKFFLQETDISISAGPAALAQWIARLADWPRKEPEHLPYLEGCLIVNGSRHEASNLQIKYAVSRGFQRIQPSDLSQARSKWIILNGENNGVSSPLELARDAGLKIARIISDVMPEALFVIGGDTARGIVNALGSPPIYPIGEALAGIPVARISLKGKRRCDLYLLTKAGGFGSLELIVQIIEFFSALNRQSIGSEGEHHGTK
jgi:D-threonate/D-erythronate kinase